MNENHYGESSFATEEVAEHHQLVDGVIQSVPAHEHIEELKRQIESLKADYLTLQDRGRQLQQAKTEREERVKTVLFDLYKSDEYDEDTILAVMRNLDIDTRTTKSFEVNVTFNVEIEYALGEEVDSSNLEWDLEFDVTSSSYEVVDSRSDIIFCNED